MGTGAWYCLGLVATLSMVIRADDWRCHKVADFINYFYDYSLENPIIMKVIDDLENDIGYSLDRPEERHDLACDIIEAAPSMHALSNSLGLPYFKIQHYFYLIQSMFDIEYEEDWKALLYMLQGRALFVERARAFFNTPGVEWTRGYVEDFAGTMQNLFGAVVKGHYSYLPFLNGTPEEIANAHMQAHSQEMPPDASTHWELLVSRHGIGEFVNLTRGLRLALEFDLMPLLDDGDPQIPVPPEECQAVFELLHDYLIDESAVGWLRYTANRLAVEYHLSRDLLDPDVLLEVACDLSDLESIEALAEYAHVPLHQVEEARDRLVDTVAYQWGNIRNLRAVRRTLSRVVDFLSRTGFPAFPLENVGDVPRFLRYVRNLGHEAHIHQVFPTESMTDDELEEAITSSTSLREYMDAIAVSTSAGDQSSASPRESMKTFVKNIEAHSLFLDILVRLLNMAEDKGILEFEH